MSKIGKMPVSIPPGVSVSLEGSSILVKGPKGELTRKIPRGVEVKVEGDEIIVSIKKESSQNRALHGTLRALIANMVKGVSTGWNRELELIGTGYRAEVAGETLRLTVGYSHPVEVKAPKGVTFQVVKSDITVSGFDKEAVGHIASFIRGVRPPEPYKGKGIRYKGEVVRRKAGKAAKAQA